MKARIVWIILLGLAISGSAEARRRRRNHEEHRMENPHYMYAHDAVKKLDRLLERDTGKDVVGIMVELKQFIDQVQMLEAMANGIRSKVQSLHADEEESKQLMEAEAERIDAQVHNLWDHVPMRALGELKDQLIAQMEQEDRFVDIIENAYEIAARIRGTRTVSVFEGDIEGKNVAIIPGNAARDVKKHKKNGVSHTAGAVAASAMPTMPQKQAQKMQQKAAPMPKQPKPMPKQAPKPMPNQQAQQAIEEALMPV